MSCRGIFLVSGKFLKDRNSFLILQQGEKVAIARPISHTVCSMMQEPVNITAKAGVEGMVALMIHGADKLSEKESNATASLLLEFKDVITVGENNFGHTSLVYHSIDIGSSKPVCQQAK